MNSNTSKVLKTILIIALIIVAFPFVLTIGLAKDYGKPRRRRRW